MRIKVPCMVYGMHPWHSRRAKVPMWYGISMRNKVPRWHRVCTQGISVREQYRLRATEGVGWR